MSSYTTKIFICEKERILC